VFVDKKKWREKKVSIMFLFFWNAIHFLDTLGFFVYKIQNQEAMDNVCYLLMKTYERAVCITNLFQRTIV
jgi:hypothetical protein